MGSRENCFRSVGCQNINNNLNTSKNKNTDQRVKETYATMPIQVTYESNHISLLHDSAMSNALNFCFLRILL